MSENRTIKYLELDEVKNVADFFERHSGVDINNVNEKYKDTVAESMDLIRGCCKVAMIYKRFGIDSKTEDSVVLSTGHVLTGKMLPRVLEHANEIYAFVIAMQGFNDFKADDIMVEYFGDTWATSYVEGAQAILGDLIIDELANEGMKRTHMWCPGQMQFGLENQRVIFDLLKPEDINCTLTSRCMMVPVKASSGLVGVVSMDREETLKPCDYCTFGKTCPASKRGCAAL